MKQNQVILSFSDCWQTIKHVRWLILISAVLFGSLFFGRSLLKPPTFTAEGVFKRGIQAKISSFSKAMEFFEGSESYSSSDDPKVFLRSYPVMKEVVCSLNLQLSIREKKRRSLFTQIWHTLKAERVQRLLKSKRPDSSILALPVASEAIFPDSETSIQCVELDYPGLVSCDFDLSFLDESHFQIEQGKNIIGKGELGIPFKWEGGAFILNSNSSLPIAGKSFHLTFIPLYEAAKSLEKMIQVKRSKKHSSLVSVSYTHTNRHLATAVVNATMDAFQKYLKDEGKQKIAKQLGYLQQRQEEAFDKLETVMEKHKTYLEAHLDSGELLMLENELAFMAQQQVEARRQLDSLADKMQGIHQVLSGEDTLIFPLLLEKLRSERPSQIHALTAEGAKALIHEHEYSLDLIQMEQEQYNYCLTKLSEPDFDISSLTKMVDDPTLKNCFNKIHSLHRNLIDEKNWTAKERQHLQEELNTERLFLVKHINDLKEGAALQDEVLRGRLHRLQESMLFLLLDRYEGTENSLHNSSLKASHFPQKWLTEQKIALNTRLHTEMIESITKMIEAKNIGYHLDYLNSVPLMRPHLPVVPNPPHLFFGFIVGSCLGALLLLAGALLREVWLGPTASYSNLKNEGKSVISFAHTMDDLKNVHYRLKRSGSILSIAAKNFSFAKDLSLLFAKSGEKVLLIDLSAITKTQTFTDTEFGQQLSLGEPENLKEIYLGSDRFQKLLAQQNKCFNRILIFSSAPLASLEVRLAIDLSDRAVVVLRDQRWSDLPHLPEESLYVTEISQKRALSIAEIVPYLGRVINLSRLDAEKCRLACELSNRDLVKNAG